MKLSRYKRFLLSNQFTILEEISKDENLKKYYSECKEAVDNGYEHEYETIFQNTYEETMSKSECMEVISTIAMFKDIEYFLNNNNNNNNNNNKELSNNFKLKFFGYDGNNECNFLGYSEYYCRKNDIKIGDLKSFNSHMPMRARYQSMLAIYKTISTKRDWVKEDLKKLID